MLFSRGSVEKAKHDFARLQQNSDPETMALLQEARDLLLGFLRFDPHLQGQGAQHSPLRILYCGPLFVIYRVFPLDDRYVSIEGFGLNPNWTL